MFHTSFPQKNRICIQIIVNSQFVKIKEPKGGAEEVYQKLAEIVK